VQNDSIDGFNDMTNQNIITSSPNCAFAQLRVVVRRDDMFLFLEKARRTIEQTDVSHTHMQTMRLAILIQHTYEVRTDQMGFIPANVQHQKVIMSECCSLRVPAASSS
jgi:hypothetical protein